MDYEQEEKARYDVYGTYHFELWQGTDGSLRSLNMHVDKYGILREGYCPRHIIMILSCSSWRINADGTPNVMGSSQH